MVPNGRERENGPEGVWRLKVAIFMVSLGLFATVLDQVAAGVILYLTAFAMISLFIRKSVRPAYRKYVKPLQGLTEKLEEISSQQDTIEAQLLMVREKVEHVETASARIEKGAEIAAERASAAINVAEAVRRQLGVVARGDPDVDDGA